MPKKSKWGTQEDKKMGKKAKEKLKNREQEILKQKKKDDEIWQETDKHFIKKQKKQQEKQQKKEQELLAKQEKKLLEQEDQQKLDKKKPQKFTKQNIIDLQEQAKRLKEKKDKEIQQQYQNDHNIIRTKISDDLDQEFEHLYKMERPMQEDEVETMNVIKALQFFDGKQDLHPERRVKAAFANYMEVKLPEFQADYPNLKFKQYKNLMWKEFVKSDLNPMNNTLNFDWSQKHKSNQQFKYIDKNIFSIKSIFFIQFTKKQMTRKQCLL